MTILGLRAMMFSSCRGSRSTSVMMSTLTEPTTRMELEGAASKGRVAAPHWLVPAAALAAAAAVTSQYIKNSASKNVRRDCLFSAIGAGRARKRCASVHAYGAWWDRPEEAEALLAH